MQQYILIKPVRGPARLHLGIIDDLPEPWRYTARQLMLRRQIRMARRFQAKHFPSSLDAASLHNGRTFQHTHF